MVGEAPECAGFLTLTFSDNVQDADEASRRFHSFRIGVLRRIAVDHVWVRERQKSGRWHYHLVVRFKKPIRQGYDFEAVRCGDYRSASQALRAYWAFLRVKCEAYGFGRHQLEPVMHPEAAGAYLAKYMAKAERAPQDKGVRLWGYSEGVKALIPSRAFQFVRGKAREWRACLAEVCRRFGFAHDFNPGVLRCVWGPKWAWNVLLMMRRNPGWVADCLVAYDGG